MVNSKHLNMLVVHGGRNDERYAIEGSSFFGDFYILQLENLTWVSVVLSGDLPSPRCSHSLAVVNSKLIIFGGIFYNNYCSADPQVLEMDQLNVRTLEKSKIEIFEESRDKLSKEESVTHLTKVNCNYNGLMSYLPVPTNNELPKRIRRVATKQVSIDRLESPEDTRRNSPEIVKEEEDEDQ